MSKSDIKEISKQLDRLEVECLEVAKDKNLLFLVPFLDHVDSLAPGTVIKNRQYAESLKDTYSGKVVLQYKQYTIEVSHINGNFTVLFSKNVLDYLAKLEGDTSIKDSSGVKCDLKYYSVAQTRRQFETYTYESLSIGIHKIERDILTVLHYVVGMLQKESLVPTEARPLENLSRDPIEAEYSEYLLYLSFSDAESRFAWTTMPTTFSQWSNDEDTIKKRAKRNEIRRENGWREDDGTLRIDGFLSSR